MGRYILGEDYARALRGRELIRREVDAALEGVDGLFLPALAIPAPKIGVPTVRIGGAEEPVRNIMLRCTQAFNVSGHPAVALPCGATTEALPIGAQIVGAYGDTTGLLRVAAAGNPLKVVDDQSGRPTAAGDLAKFILSQAGRIAAAPAGDAVFGILHYANAGEVTWRGFAQAIFAEALGAQAPEVAATTTAEYVTPARRPLRATMDLGKLERVFGVRPRSWEAALKEIVAELKAQP